MPKFIWIASVFIKDKKAMSFLIDATDFENGNLIYGIIEYDEVLTKNICIEINDNKTINTYRHSIAWKIMKYFLEEEKGFHNQILFPSNIVKSDLIRMK
jgi:hypothetical protein